MNPEDLDRELDQLWAKVAPSASGELPLIPPSSLGIESGSPAREASMEAIHILKRQHREQSAQWEDMLEAKDQAIRSLTERLNAAQAQLVELRRMGAVTEHRLMQEMYDAAAKLEAGGEAIKAQEQHFRREEAMLRELLDKTRQQLAQETNRWRELERQWNEREQDYLSDLHEAQERLNKIDQSGQADRSTVRKQSEDLKEAKRAVEATLGELLGERKLREEANQEREKAHQRAAELTDRLANLQKTWDEERKQWQELWDRERSTWEVQRQEFEGWEERLRKEREAWHQQLQQKEQEVLHFSEQMTETLRQSTETGGKLKQLFQAISAPTGVQGPFIPPQWRRRLAMAGAALALTIASYPVWKYATKPRFSLVSANAVSVDNPSAVAFDGSALWVAEWSGRLLTLDPANPATVLARYPTAVSGPYHPISLALGGGYLWALDAAQSRIAKYNQLQPSVIQDSWPAPGPAPVAIAHDGQNLWSYDAVTKSIYKHLGEGSTAQVIAYRPDVDMVPTSMIWMGTELWVHDSKGKRILRFTAEAKGLRFIDSVSFDPSALSIAGYRTLDGERMRRMVWALAAGGATPSLSTLKKYKVLP